MSDSGRAPSFVTKVIYHNIFSVIFPKERPDMLRLNLIMDILRDVYQAAEKLKQSRELHDLAPDI
jgi:hypothetical protein